MSWPWSRTVPAVTLTWPVTAPRVLVLPAPLGPRSATVGPLRHLEAQVADDGGPAVAGIEVLDLQSVGHDAAAVVSVPRYAARTAVFARTSSGVPDAIIWPKSST